MGGVGAGSGGLHRRYRARVSEEESLTDLGSDVGMPWLRELACLSRALRRSGSHASNARGLWPADSDFVHLLIELSYYFAVLPLPLGL